MRRRTTTARRRSIASVKFHRLRVRQAAYVSASQAVDSERTGPSTDSGRQAADPSQAELWIALTLLDWLLIAAYFLFSFGIALFYYRRAGKDTAEFFLSGRKDGDERHYVQVSRGLTFVLAVVAVFITADLGSITEAWGLVLTASAGLGLVLILRWYWWRLNARSELTATVSPILQVLRTPGVVRLDQNGHYEVPM